MTLQLIHFNYLAKGRERRIANLWHSSFNFSTFSWEKLPIYPFALSPLLNKYHLFQNLKFLS